MMMQYEQASASAVYAVYTCIDNHERRLQSVTFCNITF